MQTKGWPHLSKAVEAFLLYDIVHVCLLLCDTAHVRLLLCDTAHVCLLLRDTAHGCLLLRDTAHVRHPGFQSITGGGGGGGGCHISGTCLCFQRDIFFPVSWKRRTPSLIIIRLISQLLTQGCKKNLVISWARCCAPMHISLEWTAHPL